MEIAEIKGRLTLAEVIRHYGLKADKHNRLKCPFHEDKTPSLQLYYKTQTAFCFSTNCSTHGKAIDVIDFILYYEKCSKHEAIKRAERMIGGATMTIQEKTNRPPATGFLERMFTYFKNAVHNSPPAQEYLQKRGLDFKQTEVGYNAGQFHHGARKEETLIHECLRYGLLLDLGRKARTGDTAYKPFGKWCICFALRNKADEIVSLYFRSTLNNKEQRHFYLRDRAGLYPGYPKAATRKLIITESIIDAATLQQWTVDNGQLKMDNVSVLALYGTNGFTEEHQAAIKQLQELKEIIFFLNGDDPGQKATAKYAPMLQAEYPDLKITHVAVPQNEDVNSLLQGYSPEILTHLIETRKEFDFIFYSQAFSFSNGVRDNASLSSNESPTEKEKSAIGETIVNRATEPIREEQVNGLNTNNPYNLTYKSSEALYQIKGFRADQLDSLKITLQIMVS